MAGMTRLAIRKGASQDRDAIEGLLKDICREFGWRFERDFSPADSDPDSYVARGGEMLVAKMGEEVVGCIAFIRKRNTALLCRFYVRREDRHAGIGGRLIRRIFADMRSSGVSVVFLGTETDNLHDLASILSRFKFRRIQRAPVHFCGEECSLYFLLSLVEHA